MASSTQDSSALAAEGQPAVSLADKTVWARAIFNEEVGTDEMPLDAKHCLRQDTFIKAIDQELQIIDWSPSGAPAEDQFFQGKVLCAPIIVLEETNTSDSHRMTHMRFSVVEGNATFNWGDWAQRNLYDGKTDELKVEVHFFLLENDEFRNRNLLKPHLIATELAAAGKGLEKLEDNRLIHIELEDIQKPLQQWLPSFRTTPIVPDGGGYDRSTEKHFPERYIENPVAFSKNCKLCHGIARELGLPQASRRESVRATHTAAPIVGTGDAAGELSAHLSGPPSACTSANAVNTTNTGSTGSTWKHPIDVTTSKGAVNHVEADERLARELQAEENGLRRRGGRKFLCS